MSDNVLVTAPPWAVAVVILAAVLVALLFSGIARLILRRRAKLRASTAILLSLSGIVVGLLLTQLIGSDPNLGSPLVLVTTLGMAVLFIGVYGAVAAHLQRPTRADIAQLMRDGESDGVEFKSTARINLHTGKKDDRMEQVIAKTVAAFLNGDGGALLIGVDDAGNALGLDADLATLRTPDLDRYELWLRDLMTTSLGTNAASLVRVDFAEVATDDGRATVCRLETTASPRPVYLRAGKSADPELWVRAGNSTRKLAVDEAANYVMQRWPMGVGSNVAAQFRAAVRFSEDR
ncbi:AlbA family DNA-binding domain-containing protein [Agromyces sp. SYSU T00194]|uniref:AlbA family DNA-binding domain-containing protein n=1 Tax=Agromyces chitinivorans TaxID=3158560 RepID=UPI0033957210